MKLPILTDSFTKNHTFIYIILMAVPFLCAVLAPLPTISTIGDLFNDYDWVRYKGLINIIIPFIIASSFINLIYLQAIKEKWLLRSVLVFATLFAVDVIISVLGLLWYYESYYKSYFMDYFLLLLKSSFLSALFSAAFQIYIHIMLGNKSVELGNS